MSDLDNMEIFKSYVVEYLDKIEAMCKRWSVPMSKITLIMRDPDNDNMFIALTNETQEGLSKATELAMGAGYKKHDRENDSSIR